MASQFRYEIDAPPTLEFLQALEARAGRSFPEFAPFGRDEIFRPVCPVEMRVKGVVPEIRAGTQSKLTAALITGTLPRSHWTSARLREVWRALRTGRPTAVGVKLSQEFIQPVPSANKRKRGDVHCGWVQNVRPQFGWACAEYGYHDAGVLRQHVGALVSHLGLPIRIFDDEKGFWLETVVAGLQLHQTLGTGVTERNPKYFHVEVPTERVDDAVGMLEAFAEVGPANEAVHWAWSIGEPIDGGDPPAALEHARRARPPASMIGISLMLEILAIEGLEDVRRLLGPRDSALVNLFGFGFEYENMASIEVDIRPDGYHPILAVFDPALVPAVRERLGLDFRRTNRST